MSQEQIWGGYHIRKLWPTEQHKFRDHLMRLDRETRRRRFAHAVSDDFIDNYTAQMFEFGSLVFGCFEGTDLHGTAELRKLCVAWGPDAEAAFAIEREYQHRGIGTALMGRLIRSARNRAVDRLFMVCLVESREMQAIARKYDATLEFEHGGIVGRLTPANADYLSFLAEAVDDRADLVRAILEIQTRRMRAA